MRIAPLIRIHAKWLRVVQGAGEDFKAGIQNPREDWATATVRGAENYAAGVQAAISNQMFQKGVQAAGSAKWLNRTLTIGAPRWIQGVQASGANYRTGYEKYWAVINGLTLPPRGPAGSPQNIERVRVLTEALHAAKIAGGA